MSKLTICRRRHRCVALVPPALLGPQQGAQGLAESIRVRAEESVLHAQVARATPRVKRLAHRI